MTTSMGKTNGIRGLCGVGFAVICLGQSGCASTAPQSALLRLSTQHTGCGPAERLQLSGYRPAVPRENKPERWIVTGCGREYRCSSYLLSTGGRAISRCIEADDSVRQRLERASSAMVAAQAGCSRSGVKVTGHLARDNGRTRLQLLEACGRSFRCVTGGVGGDKEQPTRCRELKAQPGVKRR